MLLVRTAAIAAAAAMAVFAVKRLVSDFQMVRATIRPQPSPLPPVKLRQDPRTGIYYPED